MSKTLKRYKWAYIYEKLQPVVIDSQKNVQHLSYKSYYIIHYNTEETFKIELNIFQTATHIIRIKFTYVVK